MNRRQRYYRWLLQQPEWRELRKRIITERGSKCQHCGNIHDLEVHHRRYQRGKLPWEYPDHNFRVLCSDCHQRITYRWRRRFQKLKKWGKRPKLARLR